MVDLIAVKILENIDSYMSALDLSKKVKIQILAMGNI